MTIRNHIPPFQVTRIVSLGKKATLFFPPC